MDIARSPPQIRGGDRGQLKGIGGEVRPRFGRYGFPVSPAGALMRWTRDGDVIWSEWEMTGTGPGDSNVILSGVVIANAPGGGPIAHTRFYIEPVVDLEPSWGTRDVRCPFMAHFFGCPASA